MGTNEDDDIVWQKVKNVPKLKKWLACLCAFFDIFIPGIGTIIAACSTDEEKVSKTQLIIGILQFFTSIVLIGWFWSWYWAYLFVGKSFEFGEFANTGKTPQNRGQGQAVSQLNSR